jgi:hypothetical protein
MPLTPSEGGLRRLASHESWRYRDVVLRIYAACLDEVIDNNASPKLIARQPGKGTVVKVPAVLPSGYNKTVPPAPPTPSTSFSS